MWRLILVLLIVTPAAAQREAGKEIVKTLAAPDFHGRGYTNKGGKLASDYIKGEFSKTGLKSFRDSYFQNFFMDVNTFPDSVSMTVDGTRLYPGSDFIIDPASGSAKGKFKLKRFTPGEEMTDISVVMQDTAMVAVNVTYAYVLAPDPGLNNDEMLVYRSMKYQLSQLGPVIWVTPSKLTWGVSTQSARYPIIEVYDSLFNVEGQEVELNINNALIGGYQSRNVIGYVPAAKTKHQDKYKVITAHYDHLGDMGSTAYIPGANDNASGVAMMMLLAQYYAKNPPKKFSVAFIAFGAEEVGLLGSAHFVNNPLIPLEQIQFLLNLDLQGTGEEGIAVVNATLHDKAFKRLAKLNKKGGYFPKIKKRGEAANSDHYYFTKKGVRAFFIYTMGGIKAYHDIYDKAETLPLNKFNELFELYLKFLKKV